MKTRTTPNAAARETCGCPQRSYRKLGTLADPEVPGITCSDYVARRVMTQFQVVPFGSFERAAEAVDDGDVNAFFVPGAYREVAKFIHSGKYRLTQTIVVPIPALVYAGLQTDLPQESTVVFYQPATESLLTEIPTTVRQTAPVGSNALACRSVLNIGGTATTITNQPCAAHFGLITYRILRPAQPMPFYVFCAAISKPQPAGIKLP